MSKREPTDKELILIVARLFPELSQEEAIEVVAKRRDEILAQLPPELKGGALDAE